MVPAAHAFDYTQSAGTARPSALASRAEMQARVRGMDGEEAMREVARLFAGQFLGELWSAMRRTVRESPIGHGGTGERVFRDFADREAAMQVAYGGGFGLADLVYQSLNRRGAIRTPPPAEEPTV